MKLLRAELARLTARRFTRVMVLLLIAAFGITIATTLASSHVPTAGELSSAQARAEQQRQRAEAAYERCIAGHREPPSFCEDIREVETDTAAYLPGVFVFEREIRPLTYFLVAFLVLFGFLVGASYIGAELTSGGMTNLLLWRPERLTVLGTKLGTLTGVMLVLSLIATLVYLGAFWTIARLGGLLGDIDAEFTGWLVGTTARGLILTLLAAVLGFTIATLGRHTAAALGAVAAYGIVWEIGGRIVLTITEVARPDQWMLSTYIGAWMAGKLELWDRSACTDGFGYCDGHYTITWTGAIIVLLVLAGGFVAAAFTSFQRRDLA